MEYASDNAPTLWEMRSVRDWSWLALFKKEVVGIVWSGVSQWRARWRRRGARGSKRSRQEMRCWWMNRFPSLWFVH